MQSLSNVHVAIVMDGNGRWATRQGLPRAAGHAAGVEALRRTVEAAPDVGIGTLSVFAFSADNWRRPTAEVEALMTLLRVYLARETRRLVEAGVRLTMVGRRDRLEPALVRAIASAEDATRSGTRLWLRVAVDYSSRDALLAVARHGVETKDDFAAALAADPSPDVDLMIRTGGEKRLSDFLLWECAYAELLFTDLAWPDFDKAALDAAMADYAARDRRFGALPELVAQAA